MAAGLYNLFSKLKQPKQVKAALTTAAASDPTWNEAYIIKTARETFMRYQDDWSNGNADAMKSYMSPSYQSQADLMIQALALANRKNLVTKVVIDSVVVIDLRDAAGSDNDCENFLEMSALPQIEMSYP